MLNILGNYMNFMMIYHFYLRGKVEMLVANLHDKTEHVLYIRNLKQALTHRLILKKVNKVMKFN